MPKFCASIGVLFTFAAVILLVFGEIGQLTPSLIPRHLRIVSIDTSGVGVALAAAAKEQGGAVAALAGGNFSDIYSTQVLGEGYFTKKTNETIHTGLRKSYEWAFWSYCTTNGDLGSSRSYCLERSIDGPRFHPAQVLLEDIPETYATLLKDVLPDTVFTADDYLSSYTRGATYATMVGALCAALSALFALFARRGAFILASLLAIISFLGLAVGNVIWTVIVNRAIKGINDATTAGTDLGITVSYGNALWIMWAATALMLASILPLAISCCTGRSDAARY
ncbi:hypothetical protein JCM8547_005319 [Rhodosporidiobolus lusitaniae]